MCPVNTGYPVKHLFAQTWDEHKVLVICTSKLWAKPESSFTKGVNFLEKSWLPWNRNSNIRTPPGFGGSWFLSSSLSLAPWCPLPQKAHDKGATGEPYLTSHDLRIPSTCQITPHTEFFYGNIKQLLQQYVMICRKMSPLRTRPVQLHCWNEVLCGWGRVKRLFTPLLILFLFFLFLTNCTFTTTATWECVDFPSF